MGNMTFLSKLIRADLKRKNRFYTANGHLVLSFDVLPALITTTNRYLFDRYSDLPWLPYPTIRFIAQRLRGRRLFEFGSGTSTKWFSERCREVFSIENNVLWFNKVRSRLACAP